MDDWVEYDGTLFDAFSCFHSSSLNSRLNYYLENLFFCDNLNLLSFFWKSSGKSLALGKTDNPCPWSFVCPDFHASQSGFFFSGSLTGSLVNPGLESLKLCWPFC